MPFSFNTTTRFGRGHSARLTSKLNAWSEGAQTLFWYFLGLFTLGVMTPLVTALWLLSKQCPW